MAAVSAFRAGDGRGGFWDDLAELDYRTSRLVHLDEHREPLSQTPLYREALGWPRCFRGIGTANAMVPLTELHAIGRFTAVLESMGFLGLTPSEQSSGKILRLGSITKAGNGRVRRILLETAWHQQHVSGRGKLVQARCQQAGMR